MDIAAVLEVRVVKAAIVCSSRVCCDAQICFKATLMGASWRTSDVDCESSLLHVIWLFRAPRL